MRSFSGLQSIVMEQIQYDLDTNNDPMAYRLRQAILNCNTEEDIIRTLLQGLKAYKDTLGVVKTVKKREMDLRGDPITFILSEDQIQKISDTKI